MSDIDKAIEYFADAIKESNEIISECSEMLQAELTEQKRHFEVGISALQAQSLNCGNTVHEIVTPELKARIYEHFVRCDENTEEQDEYIEQLRAEIKSLKDTNKALDSSLYNAEMNLSHMADENTRLKALTLKELKQMDGEPVWVDDIKAWGIIEIDTNGIYADKPFVLGHGFNYDIGKRKLKCYCHKPKEESESC